MNLPETLYKTSATKWINKIILEQDIDNNMNLKYFLLSIILIFYFYITVILLKVYPIFIMTIYSLMSKAAFKIFVDFLT